MSFKSWIDDVADAISGGIRGFANSGVAGKTVGKTARLGLDMGKKIGSTGLHISAFGLSKIFDGVSWIIDHREGIGRTAKNIGAGVADEGFTWAKAGVNFIEKLAQSGKIIEKTDVDKSLLGWKFTKGAKTAITAGAFLTGTIGASKDYLTQGRTGRNDGRTYSPTPDQTSPYSLSYGMANSPSIGQSFANNAGATGDLVFALSNMRR